MVEKRNHHKRIYGKQAYRPGSFTFEQRESARRSPCAYCGRRENASKGVRVEAHHAIPLEFVGDSVIQIPVPLCNDNDSTGCHAFFDALYYDNKVTYHEYVADTERLRRKDRPRREALRRAS